MSNTVSCNFCMYRCRLAEGDGEREGAGETGICGVRQNRNGQIETTVYGQVAALGIDPIEKKPFYHVFPGRSTFSVALPGCNFHCTYCQNYELSQYRERGHGREYKESSRSAWSGSRYLSPEAIAAQMTEHGLNIMAYTYSDPVVWQDYMLDTASLVKQVPGGMNCMITNGSMTPETLESMLGLIDAFNIDVKGNTAFYRQYCGGWLEPILQNIARIEDSGKAVVEVTTLVIEGIHTLQDIRTLGGQLFDAGVKVWHLSRFFPAYKMLDRAPTTEAFLIKALEAASESGIPFIYSGNSSSRSYSATICPGCGKVLIPSHSYSGEAGEAARRNIPDGKCRKCGTSIYGLFN